MDPDLILKPRLTGEIATDGGTTIVSYGIDARSSSRAFFLLVLVGALLALVGALLALVFGIPVPGPAFFCLVLAGVCLAFANGIWGTVPNARQNELLLERWLRGCL